METEPRSIEIFSYQEIVAKLVDKFGVPEKEVKNLIKMQLGCREEGDWKILPSNQEGNVILKRAEASNAYLIGTTTTKRWSSEKQMMVDSVSICLKERIHLSGPNVSSTSGRNETGHYLPPSRSGHE